LEFLVYSCSYYYLVKIAVLKASASTRRINFTVTMMHAMVLKYRMRFIKFLSVPEYARHVIVSYFFIGIQKVTSCPRCAATQVAAAKTCRPAPTTAIFLFFRWKN